MKEKLTSFTLPFVLAIMAVLFKILNIVSIFSDLGGDGNQVDSESLIVTMIPSILGILFCISIILWIKKLKGNQQYAEKITAYVPAILMILYSVVGGGIIFLLVASAYWCMLMVKKIRFPLVSAIIAVMMSLYSLFSVIRVIHMGALGSVMIWLALAAVAFGFYLRSAEEKSFQGKTTISNDDSDSFEAQFLRKLDQQDNDD